VDSFYEAQTLLEHNLQEVNSQLAVKRNLANQLSEVQGKIIKQELSISIVEDAAVVLASAIEKQQKELKVKVEALVTHGLKAVFQDDYQFVIQQSWEGNQPSITFCVANPNMAGGKPIPLKDAKGGGLVQIVAFILRAVILISTRPKLRPIMVLDEPLTMVSDEYRDNLVQLIPELAEKAGIQFIIITHDNDLANIGDKSYRFELKDGQTRVETL